MSPGSKLWACLVHKRCMSTLGLCGAARWQESQLIKSNMFTEGENVWMEAGVEMTAPCWEKTNVTSLRMNRRHAATFCSLNVWYVFEWVQTIVWRSPTEHERTCPFLHIGESCVTAHGYYGYFVFVSMSWHNFWTVPHGIRGHHYLSIIQKI